MPYFGEERKGKQLGKKSKYSVYTWVKCPGCNKGKWTQSHILYDENFISKTRCQTCCGSRPYKINPYLRKQTISGYVIIFVPIDDPFIKLSKTPNKNGAWIPEHRYVMSKHINRVLRHDESIHHKNGIRNDNRIENLELWSILTQRAGQRIEDIALEYVKSLNDDELTNFLKRARSS